MDTKEQMICAIEGIALTVWLLWSKKDGRGKRRKIRMCYMCMVIKKKLETKLDILTARSRLNKHICTYVQGSHTTISQRFSRKR